MMPWKQGRCMVWDVTCPDTLAPSYGVCQVQFEHIKLQRSRCWSSTRLVTRTCIVHTVRCTTGQTDKIIWSSLSPICWWYSALHSYQQEQHAHRIRNSSTMHFRCATMVTAQRIVIESTKSDAVQFTLGIGHSVIEEVNTVCVSGVAIQPSKWSMSKV